MTSIPKRQIALSIQLGKNTQSGQPSTFAETGTSSLSLGSLLGGALGATTGLGGGGNTLNIAGLRVSVKIRDAYLPKAKASVRVWGLSQSLMNQLSSLGAVRNDIPMNQISISAGDDQVGQYTIFNGTIWAAYGEYENQPDVPLSIEANALAANQVTSATPTTYPQSFSIEEAFKTLAQKMGLQFTNLGVSGQLPAMYVSGSPFTQVRKLAAAARINVGINPSGFLEIIPKNKGRSGNVITISPQNGMIAYPAFTPQGLMVKTIFRPEINVFNKIQVQSSVLSAITQIRNAAGANVPTTYVATKIDLDLDAQMPKGQWMQTIFAYGEGDAVNITPPTT